jgi:D-amino-acid dehydrogenase
MPKRSERYDVVIIGAGIIGLSVAHYLLSAGQSVLIADRKGVAEETSKQNAGALAFSDIFPLASPRILAKAPRWLLDPLGPLAIRPAYALKILPWLIRFGIASRPKTFQANTKVTAGLMKLARQEFHQMMTRVSATSMIRHDGSLEVYESEPEFKASLSLWDARRELGISFEHVQGERLWELQPGLSSQIFSGTYVPEWETVSDPHDVAQAIFQHSSRAGAQLFKDDAVSVAPDHEGACVRFKSGKAILAKKIVIATGAWSRHFATALGDNIPLETERGYNATLPAQAFELKRQIIFGRHGFVATPLAGGIRIGGAVEFGGLELPPNFERSSAMLAKACQLLPNLKSEGGQQWMGFRPSLPDSLPVIGPSRASTCIVYAFGHGHLGLTQSAATGRLVRDFLLSRPSSISLVPFSATRFGLY